MKKIHVWCIVMTVLFLVLGLAKATAASLRSRRKKIPIWQDWRKSQPIASPLFARLMWQAFSY